MYTQIEKRMRTNRKRLSRLSKRLMKAKCKRVIAYTLELLKDLEDVELQERYSAIYRGVCGLYRDNLRADIGALVELYNEEMLGFLKTFIDEKSVEVSKGYLITIPRYLYDVGRGSFKGELLNRRKHFLRFILNKLRESQAYFNHEPNKVQDEVLEWLEAEINKR